MIKSLLFFANFVLFYMAQRYFIKLSYAGTAYHGWQVQENTAQTVQQVLNDALSMLLREKVETTGCGRTDTGVHAREFYAHFDSEKADLHKNEEHWLYKLNSVLPQDIAVQRLIGVSEDAHARFSAVSRTYEYIISTKKDPFLQQWAWQHWKSMDTGEMNKAAEALFDYLDFSAFSKSNTQVKTNNCKISHARWETRGDLMVFTITADRFLRNMVRAIVGTLTDTGQGKLTIEQFRNIIEGKNRSDAGASVPACGLYLTRVEYPGSILK
jgi:tRNA pseudouridine38-40 synthase